MLGMAILLGFDVVVVADCQSRSSFVAPEWTRHEYKFHADLSIQRGSRIRSYKRMSLIARVLHRSSVAVPSNYQTRKRPG
jgi:hypothetical protein